jgi:hypothetical protein
VAATAFLSTPRAIWCGMLSVLRMPVVASSLDLACREKAIDSTSHFSAFDLMAIWWAISEFLPALSEASCEAETVASRFEIWARLVWRTVGTPGERTSSKPSSWALADRRRAGSRSANRRSGS